MYRIWEIVLWPVIIFVLSLVLTSCLFLQPLDGGGASDVSGDVPNDRISVAQTINNGTVFNGLGPNGLNLNGLNLNGIEQNGLNLNGLNLNGLNLNGLNLNGIPLDSQQREDFKEVYQYLVECALEDGQSATLHQDGGPDLIYYGSLGVAPEWRSGELSEVGEHCVSACLAGRANGLGRTVLLSLRGCNIATTPQEEDLFTSNEGIFWGNLFNDTAYIKACMVDGGGISGRVCAESDGCGFDFRGVCGDVCVYDYGTGSYTSCDGESNLIHTWLNLSNRLHFGDTNAVRRDNNYNAIAWGENQYGQVVEDPAQQPYLEQPTVLGVLSNDNAELIIHHHGCARKKDGQLWCWGRNDQGQVGNDTRDQDPPHAHPTPEKISSNVAQVTIGKFHSCLLKTSGKAKCWGKNSNGQLGIDDKGVVRETSPHTVSGMSQGVVRLSAGSTTGRHVCAIKADDTVWCWGDNRYGQLGNGKTKDKYAPKHVDVDEEGNSFAGVTDICASKTLTCARKIDGTAWCWGGESNAPYHSKKPRQYVLDDPGQPAVRAAPGGLACGTDWVCFVATDSRVWCMGDNEWGQLGYNTGGADSARLEPVPGLTGVMSVNAARTQTCATRSDNTVWCWGTDPGEADQGPAMFSPQLNISPQEIDLGVP